MKKLYLCFFSLLVFFVSTKIPIQAQEKLSAHDIKLYYEAKQLYLNPKTKEDRVKAYEYFKANADSSIGISNYFLGKIFQRGFGTKKNTQKGLQILEKASKEGCSWASVDLGNIYHHGILFRQDYTKAVYYYNLSLTQDKNAYTMYRLGRMYFMGLGCHQDYQKAFELFLESSRLGNAGGSHMLGLCYRNGYGTEPNPRLGYKILKRLADGGYSQSIKELTFRPDPSGFNQMSVPKIDQSTFNDIVDQSYNFINHNLKNYDLSGTYEGYLITYDWSGSCILNINNIKLSLDCLNYKFSGTWIENDTIATSIRGVLASHSIQFDDSEYSRFENGIKAYPKKYKFKEIRCNIVNHEGGSYLSGNIEFYLSKDYEPSQPMSFVLCKKSLTPIYLKSIISNVSCSPNPVINDINIELDLKSEGIINIGLFDTNQGDLIYTKKVSGPTGISTIKIPVNGKCGVYLLKVSYGNDVRAIKFVKL
ncbi:MAG: SEL1-like repeat protein [Candidatus Delongbacteria bacterium]|nr:SEL1-like repeat protein [Candidatus Delongbacteria bacterium]